MVTHPVVFITTIGIIKGNHVVGIAPFATCLDTSYNPPYITFSAAIKQHSIQGERKNKGKMNTVLNLKDVDAFIVNVPGKNLLPVMDIIAFPYERKLYRDKVEHAHLTKLNPFKLSKRKLFPPLIKECLAHVECRLIDIHQPRGSDHYNMTGKVVSASYDKQLGTNCDEIRHNLARKTFHHIGTNSENSQERYIVYSDTIVKKKKALVFELERKR